MIDFLWPWIFVLLPLPLLLRLLLPRAKTGADAALLVPDLADYRLGDTTCFNGQRPRWPLLLYTLAWICLLTAAARPQWTGEAVELPVSGRDLMLAIDISKSMDHPIRHEYGAVSRITATKAVASAFIEKRAGDRIGLILFGDQAYVQVPLTFDRTTVITLLQEAVTGLAGQATAIGDAIGLAVKRLAQQRSLQQKLLQQQPAADNAVEPQHETDTGANTNTNTNASTDQVLILLTDGVSNRGEMTPLKAAELAAGKGLKIHTVGIANRNSRELDEDTLRKIASITGGQYFRAYNTADLQQIYELLDELEPVAKDVKSYRPVTALFYLPLSAALLCAAVLALLFYLPQLSLFATVVSVNQPATINKSSAPDR